MSKLLTVFGATGQQGGALVNYVLKSPGLSKLYHLRAITRDASKPSALALKERGVEVIQADLDQPSTLIPAVAGSYAVFAVTNCESPTAPGGFLGANATPPQVWEKASLAVEIAQGKAIADASVAGGVTLLIWSSLPNSTRMTGGKSTALKHFDSKAEVEVYIRSLPIKSAFFMAGWYMQNHVSFLPPLIVSLIDHLFKRLVFRRY